MHLLQRIPDAPYIIMSGADLVPLGRTGPTELKRIISWAIRWKGIIVIDEAECALKSRYYRCKNQSVNDSIEAAIARDVINVFLSLTGEASSDLMLIIVTSHPERLDGAVLDRCDEVLHLSLPCQTERFLIIKDCFSNRFCLSNICGGKGKPLCQYASDFDMTMLHKLSLTDTEGFSGREIDQIMKAISEETLMAPDSTLTCCIWERVTKRMCCAIKAKKRYSEK